MKAFIEFNKTFFKSIILASNKRKEKHEAISKIIHIKNSSIFSVFNEKSILSLFESKNSLIWELLNKKNICVETNSDKFQFLSIKSLEDFKFTRINKNNLLKKFSNIQKLSITETVKIKRINERYARKRSSLGEANPKKEEKLFLLERTYKFFDDK